MFYLCHIYSTALPTCAIYQRIACVVQNLGDIFIVLATRPKHRSVDLGETDDGLRSEKTRVEERIVADGAKQIVLLVAVERRLTNHHLVK